MRAGNAVIVMAGAPSATGNNERVGLDHAAAKDSGESPAFSVVAGGVACLATLGWVTVRMPELRTYRPAREPGGPTGA